MPFWSKTSAAPRWIDTWFTNHTQRSFLRIKPPAEPKTPEGLSPPVRLTIDDVGTLSAFWTASYGGDDWYMDAQPAWVSAYLKDPSIVVLGAFDGGGNLVATIVSTPFSGSDTEFSTGAMLNHGAMRVIEGLCLEKSWRSRGIAGYMIGMMDCWTSSKIPVAHLWARETASMPFFSTALRTDTYAMARTKDFVGSVSCEKMDWIQFSDMWQRSFRKWMMNEGEGNPPPQIVSTKPINRSEHIDVWITKKRPDIEAELRKVVVVVNTRRRAIPGDERIFEVVWCGYLVSGKLKPNTGTRGFRPVLESIGAGYKDSLLFASSGYMGGEARPDWAAPWRYGRSGVHSWHIYNYMPPVFGACEIMAVRDEI